MSSDFKMMTGSELLLRQARRAPFVTQVPLLDRLEEGGLPRGTLIELSGARSTGRFALVLAALSAATRAGESAALIDLGDHLDPQEAHLAGIDLPRLLWVRPFQIKEAMIAAEMILAAGFSLVVLDLSGKNPQRSSDAIWIRLSRAAKIQNALLLVSASVPLAGSAADLLIRARPPRPIWRGSRSAPRLLSGLSVDLTVCRRKGSRQEICGTIFFPVERRSDAADRLFVDS